MKGDVVCALAFVAKVVRMLSGGVVLVLLVVEFEKWLESGQSVADAEKLLWCRDAVIF